MYTYLIIGHGEYPSGVKSALQLLIGDEVPVYSLNLDQTTTHEEMEKRAEEFLVNHEKVVVFADLTGGAPHQKVSALILRDDMRSDHLIISNVSMGIMLDVIMKLQFSASENENTPLEKVLESIEQENTKPNVLCKKMMQQGQEN